VEFDDFAKQCTSNAMTAGAVKKVYKQYWAICSALWEGIKASTRGDI
jgi:uncharacterized protein (UPF0262 family)